MRISDWSSDVCSSDLLHQRLDRFRRRLHNVKHSRVSPDLKMLAGLLVDVRTAVHGKFFDPRWQRNGTADQRAGAARSVGNVASSLIEHTMIKSLQANPNILRFHVHYRCERAKNKPPKMSSRIDIPARNYPGRLKNRTARIRRFERFAAYITWRSS